MRNIRRFLRIALFLIVGLWLHYVMPQQDIVRVVKTEDFRVDFSVWNRMFYAQADSGTVELPTRQVRIINTVRKRTFFFGLIRGDDQTMNYRNEDTGWIYPPYFKFDSSNLDTEAQDLVSTAQEPEWAIITHYGWRIKLISVFPNAVSIRPIVVPEGQSPEDYRPFPWVNLIIFAAMIIGFLFVRAAWRQFRERTVDPLADKVGDQYDHVSADLSDRKGRISRWLGTWRKK
ncbi:DUF1523 family protein [Octadecabacter sp. 1_MG-2023]|uniref:DUF1523 family protein n=1 Tax=unclassified Octadecabacter TaxID=196158 RepID=UPI001C0A18C2|nr:MULTISPECIES: DUF1523 family protein [unclassified Octadecabacter]MBU2994373.1 DUF1523 family protein [Octadecabacter sp. B2R22]MDO6734337.1 DUF1523 family protein [Octadecabacter sp. 1_MG-2023]